MQFLRQLAQVVRYYYRLILWIILVCRRKFFSFLKKYFDLIRQMSFVLIAYLVALFVNHFSGQNFTQDILSNFLVASAAMTGGTIAIVFTISIFLLQSVSDIYSSQYFEIYIHDWKEKLVYFTVILITIVFFGSGLYVGGLATLTEGISSRVVDGSLVLIGIVFALIDWQYKNVRKKVSPTKTIEFLEKQGVKYLKKIQFDASRLASILQARDVNLTKEKALAGVYNRFLKPYILTLDHQLENLVEITTKLADRQEIGTTKRGFLAVYKILEKYLENRKTSSSVVPSNMTFLSIESDSQRFLGKNFERLNKAGEKLIKEDKDEIATFIILDVYLALAVKAEEIIFINQENQNPILDLIVGYLNIFVDSGKRIKNIEVVFQGSQALSAILLITTAKGLEVTLSGLQDSLNKIAIFGLTEKSIVIIDQCTSASLQTITASFKSSKVMRELHFKEALSSIATIVQYISIAIRSGFFPNDFSSTIALTKGYDELSSIIRDIIQDYYSITDVGEKKRYINDLEGLLEELNFSLRHLSEQLKFFDSVLMGSIGRLIFDTNQLIIALIKDDEFQDIKEKLKKHLLWNIHLPYWFIHHSENFENSSQGLNHLTDAVTKTGLLVFEHLQDKKLVQNSIDCLYSITNDVLKKKISKYGNDEPRILEKACYLGIIALKNGWEEIVIDLALKIYEFESKYFTQYLAGYPDSSVDFKSHNIMGLPHSDELTRELWNFRDDLAGRSGFATLRNDGKALLYKYIQPIDIDRFIFEVWSVIESGSAFDKEFELKLARRSLVYTIEKKVIPSRTDNKRGSVPS